MLLHFFKIAIILLLLGLPQLVCAQEQGTGAVNQVEPVVATDAVNEPVTVLGVLEEIITPARKVDSLVQEKLQVLGVETLEDFIELHMRLEENRDHAERDLRYSVSETEQNRLRAQIIMLEDQITANEARFEEIATGVNISQTQERNTEDLNFTQNLQLLIDPLFKALLQSTESIRVKAEIVEDINNYEMTLAQADRAVKNLGVWLERDITDASRTRLTLLLERWQNQQLEMSSNLKASQLQLKQLEADKLSMGDKFGRNLKHFFQTRGLYCLLGLFSFFLVLLVSNLIYRLLKKMTFFADGKRSFNARLFDLAYKAVSILIASLAPLVTFYVFEDWVMFSIGLLIAFGVIWSLRNVIPNMWRQGRLLLNIGAVREGERINYEGLPWRVRELNIFTELENPENKLRLRVPVENLIGLTSKPVQTMESWFPCRKGDWVILSDGFRGVVESISVELVDIEDRGSSMRTYSMQDFLALSPLNISKSFRLKETLGIAYRHQVDSTNKVLGALKRHIKQKISDEGYEPHITNLLVEFERMGESSLDITVIMDVDGSQAAYYNRIKRAMQRWCVDASTEFDWEIPFPQRTLHVVHDSGEVSVKQGDLFVSELPEEIESEAAE